LQILSFDFGTSDFGILKEGTNNYYSGYYQETAILSTSHGGGVFRQGIRFTLWVPCPLPTFASRVTTARTTPGNYKDSMTLSCDDPELTLIGSSSYSCNYMGSWLGYNGGDSPINAKCISLKAPNVQQVLDIDSLTQYGFTMQWDPLIVPGLTVNSYDVSYTIQWPYQASLDWSLSYLNGVSKSGEVATGVTALAHSFITDKKNEIEHVRGLFGIRANVNGATGPYSYFNFSTPCACDMAKALAQDNAHDAVIFGIPLNLQVDQHVDSRNDLTFSFTANSLCAKTYTISISAVDGTNIDINPVQLNTPDVDNVELCSLLGVKQAEEVAVVTYPMYGRQIQFCITPGPKPICSSCVSNYGTAGTESNGLPPEGCITFKPAFVTRISGVVSTNPSPLAPSSAPVPEVTLILTIVHPVTFEPLYFNDTKGNYVLVQQNVTTDFHGRYKATLSSNLLTNQTYGLSVMPYKIDTDFATGATVAHEFAYTAIQSDSVYTDIVIHNQEFQDISFYDLSEIPITGSVILDTTAVWYSSTSLQGCAVPSVIISAYSADDTNFKTVLRRSLPTGNDGKFVLASPLFTSLVLVPSYSGGSPYINHTFSPANVHVTVKQTAINLKAIVDTTTAQFSARLIGGLCEYHIGSIRPVIAFTSCGISAHITLPPFDQSKNSHYTLPAQLYQFKLIDSDPSSGLQKTDTNGGVLPNSYKTGDLYTWITNQDHAIVDLTSTNTPSPLIYQYFNTTQITVLQQSICSDDLVLQRTGDRGIASFMYLTANTEASLTFQLSESYGYTYAPDPNADPTVKPQVCNEVSGGVQILDYVTADQTKVYKYYLDDPYNCNTGSDPCVMPANYNATTDKTLAFYIFKAGDPELNPHNSNDLPPYSRNIRYKLAGAGANVQYDIINMVLLGSKSTPGSVALTYPPYQALYILRDPPGGDSYSLFNTGDAVSTATSVSVSSSNGASNDFSAGLGVDAEASLCEGIGVESCQEALKVKIDLSIGSVLSRDGSKSQTSTSTASHSFSQKVQTTQDPNIVNGLGDLFLTVSGSIQLQVANVIDGKVTVIHDDVTGDTYQCNSTNRPTLTWTRDPKSTLQWISAYDITYVVIPALKLANSQLFAVYGTYTETNFLAKASSADKKQYNDNTVAINGWNGLLIYNQNLKDTAVEWPEFYQHISAPGTYETKSLLDSATSNAGSKGATSATTAGQAVPTTTSAALHSDGNVGSITFYGDTASLQFDLTTESTSTSTYQQEVSVSDTESVAFSEKMAVFGVSFSLSDKSTFTMTTSHGNSGELTKTTTNTVTIFLRDPDIGDVFKVKIMKDPVYGSPVYKLVAGQSRCPAEDGAVSRDSLELSFATSAFDHVNPYDKISTVMTLTNLSPTGEDFPYSLSLLQETSRYGLIMAINGQILSSAVNLVYNIKYLEDLQVTLDISKGSNGFSFPDTRLILQGTGGLGLVGLAGHCLAVNATVSVNYDQPCSKIGFAGPLATSPSFLVNANSLLNSGGEKPVLSITVRNPEYNLKGRKYMDNYVFSNTEAGTLKSLKIQYRYVAPGQDVLSELDWTDISTVGSTAPIDILNTVYQQYISSGSTDQDYINVEWDLSALDNGKYQLRALSQCSVPIGTLDSSLYSYTTSIVTGVLDIAPPQVFGVPLPSTESYTPSQQISVTFNENIICNSYAGKARVLAWINPSSIAQPYSQGTDLQVAYTCTSSVMNIRFISPIWDNLVERLITVQVDRVDDLSGNAVEFPVIWSFFVDDFDVSSSSVHVSDLSLSVGLSELLTAYGNLNNIQQEISSEISTLINRMIDIELNPTPLASKSINGIQPGSVIVSQVISAQANLVKLELNLLALPLFPGQSKLPYTPATFAHYLQKSINQYSHNITAQMSVQVNSTYSNTVNFTKPTPFYYYQDSIQFPILQYIASTQLTDVIRPLPSSGSSNVNVNGGTSAATSDFSAEAASAASASFYNSFTYTAGLDNTITTATVTTQWQTNNVYAQNLDASNLIISYQIVADFFSDPDALAEVANSTYDWIVIPATDLSTVSLIQNVQVDPSDSSLNRAIYQLTVFHFPTQPGGRNVNIQVQLVNNTNHYIHKAYSIAENIFIVGPPSLPTIVSVVQTTLTALQFLYNPSLHNGLYVNADDTNVAYQLSIINYNSTTQSNIIVPTSIYSITTQFNSLGYKSYLVDIDLSSSSAKNIGLVLPAAGTSSLWSINIAAGNRYGSSAQQSSNLTIYSVPSYIPVYRVTQHNSLNSYQIRFKQAPQIGLNILNYNLYYHYVDYQSGNLTKGVIVYDPNTNVTLVDAASRILALDVFLPLPHGPYAPETLNFAIEASNAYGTSAINPHIVSQPAYALPPANFTFKVVKTYANNSADIKLSWHTAAVISPTSDLLVGYRINVTYTDLLSLYGEPIIVDINSGDVLNITINIPLINSPVAGINTEYFIQLSTIVYNTNNQAIQSRTDGTGLNKIYSPSTLLVVNMMNNQFLVGETNSAFHHFTLTDMDRNKQSSPFATSYPAAVQTATLNNGAAAIVPNAPFEVTTAYLQHSGVSIPAAPVAPPTISITETTTLNRILISFTISDQCNVPSACTLGVNVNSYTLLWWPANSTNDIPLGTVSINPNTQYNGQVTIPVVDSSLTGFNTDNHVLISYGHLQPQTVIPFKFSIFASNSAGQSQQTITFANVRQAPYIGDSTTSPSILAIVIVLLIFNIIQMAVIGYIVYNRHTAVKRAKKVSSDELVKAKSVATILTDSASRENAGGLELTNINVATDETH
jgi:hypothetical protein